MSPPPAPPAWAFAREHVLQTLARNLSTRYLSILFDTVKVVLFAKGAR